MTVAEDFEDDASIHLTGPQSELFLSEKKFPLFVAGFGSGKSQCLATCALRDLFHFPGSNVGIYAPTYDLLKMIVMGYIEESLILGKFRYKLDNSRHTFEVEGYGKIICRSMDNPGRIVGYEVFRSHCDEMDILGPDKARLAWTKIIARNRQKIYTRDKHDRKIPLLSKTGEIIFKNGFPQFQTEQNRVTAYSTPEGFGFCYKRWVEDPDPHKHYGMVRASTYSNEHNLPEDYIETLKGSYPSELIDAYINGLFVNLTSGRVYRKFDRKIHASNEEIIPGEHLHIGQDFNIECMASAIFVLRDGTPHAVDEIANAYDTDQVIEIINERYRDHPIHIYPDATGKKRSTSSGAPGTTDISKLKEAGFNVHVNYSNPLIRDRVNCVNAKILNGKEEISYFVNIEKCPNIVKTHEQQVWDDNGMPDKTAGLDHMGDALGYFICKMFPIIRTNAGFAKSKRRN